MIEKTYEVIFIIASFLYTLFALSLSTYKKGNRNSLIFLSAYCLAKALYILNDLFYTYRTDIYDVFPVYTDIILKSSSFLLGPLIFFFIKLLISQTFQFKKVYLLHLVPFLIDTLFRHWIFFTHHNIEDVMRNVGYSLIYDDLLARIILLDLHQLSYLIMAMYMIYHYVARLKQKFSSIDSIRLSWLNVIINGLFFIQIISLSKHTLSFYSEGLRNILGILMHTGNLAFITGLVLKALRQPEIFVTFNEKEKYQKNLLSEDLLQSYKKRLLEYMEKDRSFVNPDMTINEMSKELNIPTYHISQVLSRALNTNFYQFINNYRISEFKRIVQADHNITILEALYEAGFQSKSTFNRIFKQTIGYSPSEYIRMHIAKS